MNKTIHGHIAAFLTILIWGTTFISTKVLLISFKPVEILFIRFMIGYFALWCVCPPQAEGTHEEAGMVLCRSRTLRCDTVLSV